MRVNAIVAMTVAAGLAGSAAAPGQARAPGLATASGSRPYLWRYVDIANKPAAVVNLYQVTAVSPSDLWAAGGAAPVSGADYPVLLHWGGRAWRDWTPPLQQFSIADSDLTAIGASGPSNVWALGTSGGQSYALRWGGRAFRKYSFGKAVEMTAVAVFSASNVWAFGRQAGRGQPFVARFDGRSWSSGAMPGFGDSVSAVSANNIWAVGPPAGGGSSAPLVVSHWTGGSWQTVALPPVGRTGDVLASANILAGSGSGVWVDGEVMSSAGIPLYPVLLNWKGGTWTANRCPVRATLLGQMAVNSFGVWIAAGSGWPQPGYFIHFGGRRWTFDLARKPATALDPLVTALVRIPGTSSMLAAGILPYPLGGGAGIIYEYAR